jgi:hypothetical protein
MSDAGFLLSDITDPATYSIEEAKQKQESDARQVKLLTVVPLSSRLFTTDR